MNYKSVRTHAQYRALNRYATDFMSDEDYEKFDQKDLLSSPLEQQRIFQWNDNEFTKSTHTVGFLADFFGINLRVLSKSGLLSGWRKGGFQE